MKLIINADDFGLTKSVNKAVFELAEKGSLTSTTVMVNMPCWEEAAQLISYPHMGIGLHFNLTQGKPISDPQAIPSLVNEHGEFYSFAQFRNRCKKNLIKKQEVLTELAAQFNKLYALLGDRFTHIDSHQGVHKYTPISDAIYQFATEDGFKRMIGLRSPRHYFIHNSKVIRPNLSNITTFGLKRIFIEKYYDKYQKKFVGKFRMPEGELLDVNLKKIITLKNLAKVQSAPDVIIEIPCHPAVDITDLPESKLTDKRVEEYNILKSVEFIQSLKKFSLINFSKI